MSDAGPATLALRAATDVRDADGALVLLGRQAHSRCTMTAAEERLLPLLDGTRDLAALVRDALALDAPVTPLITLGLVRRLEATGLLGREALAPVSASRWRWLDLNIPLGRPRAPSSERGATRGASQLALLVVLCGVVLAGAAVVLALYRGALAWLLSPFATTVDVLDDAVTLYLAASATMTFRGLVRWAYLWIAGLDAPVPVLRVRVGLAFLDTDLRAKRWATRSQRADLARLGLGSLGFVLGLSGLLSLMLGVDLARGTAAVALLLLLADSCPYARTDARDLVGLVTLVSHLRSRGAAFLMRRTVRNLRRRDRLASLERVYLLVAVGWLLHAFVTVGIVGGLVLPDLLSLVARIAASDASPLDLGLSLGVALVVVGLALAMVGGLCWVALSQLRQVTAPTRGDRPTEDAPLDATTRSSFVDQASRVPFLAELPPEARLALAEVMRRENYPRAATILRQGERGDRFCYLVEGEVEVTVEEECGLPHPVATLHPGDFFGETALIEDVPRTATVTASTPVVLLTLDRHHFLDLVAASTFPGQSVVDHLRTSVALRAFPVFRNLLASEVGRLLAGCHIERRSAGETVVEQGHAADALYVIREGRCTVVREVGGETHTLDTLERGDCFGEIALLRGSPRTATVRALEHSVLVAVPQAVFTEVLLENLDVARALEAIASERLSAHEGLPGERLS